jgi:hypothetical protein
VIPASILAEEEECPADIPPHNKQEEVFICQIKAEIYVLNVKGERSYQENVYAIWNGEERRQKRVLKTADAKKKRSVPPVEEKGILYKTIFDA